jgi:hypothetical protein
MAIHHAAISGRLLRLPRRGRLEQANGWKVGTGEYRTYSPKQDSRTGKRRKPGTLEA